ncbi:putative LRR receptor-like serine/threonine-protein kinase isoform B [Glycine soja]|uniref:Putative LRR receptor-like serine/threonine-protein kinase isoform B n=1 Tax=Glycine soja TaxID=3848 RepID=A0A445J8B5_GLYSO|nr:putative LRR receptor-like serine/threonine-protein kinase isoform B [Glycine soja]
MKLYTSLLLLGLVSMLSFVASVMIPSGEVLALKTFKEAVYEDPHMVLSNWNTLDSDLCDWNGVSCTATRDHVIKLNLSGASLRGFLAPEFGKITYLQELILHGNSLIGVIPKELGMLNSLKVLDLGMNQLTGPIPPEIGNLTQVMKINLQSNGLTGRLPPELGKLKYLQELRLDRNKLQGSLPGGGSSNFSSNMHGMYASGVNMTGFCRLSQLKVADFSYNFFVGSIPKCLAYLPRSSFQGNCLHIKDIKQRISVQCDSEMLKDVMSYSRQDLEVACEDFSNIIGSSPDSVVYKGTMKGGPEIAVISLCIKEDNWTGYLELYFQREVADLARLNHDNTGKLLGYCRESSPFTRMLVFEYASNGTLYEHLHCYEEGCQLSWTRRMKIIIGIARGLKYLHTEIEPAFTISELNSNAVYLTEDFSPKLVDFESWKTILERSEKNSGNVSSQGAVCVLPNSLEARRLDTKGNIYAFAVLLLEIISGRPPYCKDKGYLVDWARDYLEMPEVMSYVVDPELKHFRYEDLKAICEVITLCINPDHSVRPSMRELCTMLESKIDTTINLELKASSLAWAELALSS